MHVLVTGATGFVGSTLCRTLTDAGHTVRALTRGGGALGSHIAESVQIDDLVAVQDWTPILRDIECVMHCAARAHVTNDPAINSKLYFETNTHASLRLARAAARAGVRRLVYLSTVKVNGEQADVAYSAADPPQPQDAYGLSKWMAESLLREVAVETGLQTVIVRPPLVYGPRVRANFLRLMRWVDRGVPLPLDRVANQRSLVSIWNLCDLLTLVTDHPGAAGKVWMVSDAEDVSTAELVRRLAAAMGKRANLLPVPTSALYLAAALTGRRAEVDRLCGSLTVNVGTTRNELGWSPPITMNEGLARTVRWYLDEARSVA